MPKSWRPEGWSKKRKQEGDRLEKEAFDPYDIDPDDFYEAGAEAMLKALKKDGTHFDKDEWTDDATFETETPGTVVFIPDEEQRERDDRKT